MTQSPGHHNEASLDHSSIEEEEMNESEVERQIEEFRRKLEVMSRESTDVKKKMKPNISSVWLSELRLRLNSISTNENSIERSHKSSKNNTERTMATI